MSMTKNALQIILAAVAFAPAFAWAAKAPTTTFDWNPRALGFEGSKFTADSIRLSDFGRVTMDPASGSFLDVGIMPILGFELGGQAVAARGYGDPTGGGWGAYVAYRGIGQQVVTPRGVVATFSQLNYEVYGYNGVAQVGLDATGMAYATGGTDVRMLGRGELIEGSLTMVPTGFVGGVPVQFAVSGKIRTTIKDVPRQFSSNTFLGFDLALVHAPGEFFPVSPTIFVANGGTSSTATLIASRGNSAHAHKAASFGVAGAEAGVFASAVNVPEPGSALLLAAGLGAFGLVRRRRRRCGATTRAARSCG